MTDAHCRLELEKATRTVVAEKIKMEELKESPEAVEFLLVKMGAKLALGVGAKANT